MVESFNMREAFPFDSLSLDVKIVELWSILPNLKEDAGGGSVYMWLPVGTQNI